jgi:hypothetical protein
MSEPEPDGEAIERDLGLAISDIVGRHERGFVLKWVAIVETVAPDGSRGLWTMTADDVKAWDTVGMLQHALHIQLRQTLNPDEDL